VLEVEEGENVAPVEGQMVISSLQEAIQAASDGGSPPIGKLINVEGWELEFASPRSGEPYPALIHALYK